MPTRRLSGITVAASEPDNGGDNSGGGSGGTCVDDVFSTYLYEGNSFKKTVLNGIDLDSEGGLVWIKTRNASKDHALFDTERGRTNPPKLRTNNTDGNMPVPDGLNSFNSDGFTVGADSGLNKTGDDLVSWTFRKAKNFFDVVTYTGDGSSSNQIPHSLGIRPGMIIVKRTDSSGDWSVLARYDTKSGQYRYSGGKASAPFGLNNTNSIETTNTEADRNVTGEHFDAAKISGPLSSTQADVDQTNQSGGQYVAYVFAHDDSDESMIKCGSYTGNGSTDGPEIDLGFEPQWVMIKAATVAGDWGMVDTMRGQGVDSATSQKFKANASEPEAYSNFIRLTSTGFKLSVAVADINGSGSKFIYMAIRRPTKPAEEFEPEELFAALPNTFADGDPGFKTGFPVDMAISDGVSMGYDKDIASRLTGTKRLETNTDNPEGNQPANKWDYMDGFLSGSNGADYGWLWRRAPGFMDVVCYEGTGANATISHNLGVTPELMLHKSRTGGSDWIVHTPSIIAADSFLRLNRNDLLLPNSNQGYTNTSAPTDTTFTVGNYKLSMGGQTYVAYLFASVPGISKVGSYTGNGSEVEVDCGFTNGARWLLIKRTDADGDWYFTSNPGAFIILSKLNTTDAPVNYQSTYNDVPSGFRVTSTSGDLCVDGAEYIFYAIA
jgi:hypothetical protein